MFPRRHRISNVFGLSVPTVGKLWISQNHLHIDFKKTVFSKNVEMRHWDGSFQRAVFDELTDKLRKKDQVKVEIQSNPFSIQAPSIFAWYLYCVPNNLAGITVWRLVWKNYLLWFKILMQFKLIWFVECCKLIFTHN